MDHGGYSSTLSLNERLLMSMVRVAENFKKKASNIFKDYGLTFAQYNVLRVLNSYENGSSTITNVGRIMLVTGANMTGLSKRLERDGYLLRNRHPSDERVTLLEITPKGRLALTSIEKEKEDILESYVGGLVPEEKQELMALLRKIVNRSEGK